MQMFIGIYGGMDGESRRVSLFQAVLFSPNIALFELEYSRSGTLCHLKASLSHQQSHC